MNEEFVKKLEDVKKLKSIKNIPFNLVIESIAGYKVLQFNKEDKKDKRVLEILKKAAELAGNNINKKGIIRPRANEVGNDIEKFVKDALNELKYKASTPTTKSGKKKSTGYPDIEFIDEFSRVNYLECKTFNIDNISTSLRSFYLSPSDDFKITVDAHHFVVSFEIYVDGTQGKKNIYKTKSWKILSLENLIVDLKNEFQSDNKRLYSKESIFEEGDF